MTTNAVPTTFEQYLNASLSETKKFEGPHTVIDIPEDPASTKESTDSSKSSPFNILIF